MQRAAWQIVELTGAGENPGPARKKLMGRKVG